MTERRFDLLLTLVLLAAGSWYAVRMLLYPSNAGRVPAIVAAVMIGALIVQLALMVRGRRSPEGRVDDPSRGPTSGTALSPPAPGVDMAVPESRMANEPEPDSYDTLIALGGVRRKRLAIVVGFSVLFFVGAMLVGFVVTTTVLLPVILLLSGERLWVAALGGVAGAVGSYALVVLLLGLPAVSGALFP